METVWNELTFGLPESKQLIQVIVRLLASVLIAGIIGFEREASGKSAGLRTHVLVALGSTVFVLGAMNAGMHEDAVSRVIQGIVTGIGFIGSGTIIKQDVKIHGLTTSAGLWTTCAIGVVVGLGEIGIALIAGALAFLVLTVVGKIEDRYVDTKGTKETVK
jgi:putative Mg2+ transporter-C (MgtC) family protein